MTLLKASLDPSTLLPSSSLPHFEACLETVLLHSHRLLPATVHTLLTCFTLPLYAIKLLDGDPDRGPQGAEQSSGRAREESARVSARRPIRFGSAQWCSTRDSLLVCCDLSLRTLSVLYMAELHGNNGAGAMCCPARLLGCNCLALRITALRLSVYAQRVSLVCLLLCQRLAV